MPGPRSVYAVFPSLEARLKVIRQTAYNELVVESTGCDECQGEDAPMEHEACDDTERTSPDAEADAKPCDCDAEE